LHEISYRACFKPQLPRFFIERLTARGDVVYDPFMGRGTTPLEAALLGRIPIGCDVNPLSTVLTKPRLSPPFVAEVAERLRAIDLGDSEEAPEDLLVFYHPETLREISALKKYLRNRRSRHKLDAVDEWIELVALNRLTGHSKGFFSVYTMPPNQAVSIKSQRKINERRKQTPPRRVVPDIILHKSKQLLKQCSERERATFAQIAHQALLLTRTANHTPEIASESVALVVTSPPFLNIVDYATDNWLRCWFLGLDAKSVRLTVPAKLENWQNEMTKIFRELARVLKKGGHVAFEVGEVHAGKTRLEEAVLPCGQTAGLEPLLVMINDQLFTKTANCWGVDNNSKGTNTNRIVVFRK
jgi:DNA methylase